MDELTVVGEFLSEERPAPAQTIAEARQRLTDEATKRHSRLYQQDKPGLRIAITVVATTTVVTVGAAAAVILSNTSTPTANPNSPPAAAQLSGRQVMLAAATTAESKPAVSGTYWHVKSTFDIPGQGRETRETWTRRDGRTWLSSVPGMVSDVGRRPLVDFTNLDFADIQRLPTDPDKLKAELLKSTELPNSGGQRQLNTINLLQSVISDAPAPPKVRAAAFGALAALPNIKNLGKTPGGYRLLISYMDSTGKRVEGTEKIVVDPKTTQLRVEGWAGFGDGGLPVGPGTKTAGWTNELPGKVVPWRTQIPYLNRP